jgi:hypothetical protein
MKMRERQWEQVVALRGRRQLLGFRHPCSNRQQLLKHKA